MSGSAGTVWLASYPKSGNTWVRAMYGAWLSREPLDLNALPGGPLASSRQLLDASLGLATSDLTADEVDLLRPRSDEVVAAVDLDPGAIRLRKVHDAFFLGPAGEPLVSVAASSGAVYVVRDPRDVAVSLSRHTGRSLAHVVRQMGDPDAEIAGRADRVEPQVRQRLGSWSEHVLSWVDQRRLPVHVLRYEDCLADPCAAWASVLGFCGVPVDWDRVRLAVSLSSFAQLQAAEDRNGFAERGPASRFFRAGRAGSWRTALGAELAERLERDHAAVMARFGYARATAE